MVLFEQWNVRTRPHVACLYSTVLTTLLLLSWFYLGKRPRYPFFFAPMQLENASISDEIVLIFQHLQKNSVWMHLSFYSLKFPRWSILWTNFLWHCWGGGLFIMEGAWTWGGGLYLVDGNLFYECWMYDMRNYLWIYQMFDFNRTKLILAQSRRLKNVQQSPLFSSARVFRTAEIN